MSEVSDIARVFATGFMGLTFGCKSELTIGGEHSTHLLNPVWQPAIDELEEKGFITIDRETYSHNKGRFIYKLKAGAVDEIKPATMKMMDEINHPISILNEQ